MANPNSDAFTESLTQLDGKILNKFVQKLVQVSDKEYRKLTFSKTKNTKVRRSKQDMIIGRPGVKAEAGKLDDAILAFDYFIPLDLQKKSVSFTNKRICATLHNQSSNRELNRYYVKIKNISTIFK